LTVKNKAGTPLAIQGRWTAINLTFDAEGRPISGSSYSIGFHIEDVRTIMIANEKFEGWKASFTDNEGNAISGRFENPMNNQTLGYVHSALITEGAAQPLPAP
jgi:hypothetical protein